MELKPNEYRCADCGGVFEKGWTDEEAKAEMAENKFDAWPEEKMAVVCDDCYQALMRQFH